MLMAHVVVLNGPAGVGKTTICKHLAQTFPRTVAISGDAVREFSPSDARDWLGPRSTYRASASLISSYLEMGAGRVLFDYIFETRDAFETFRDLLPEKTPVHLFTIWAPLETVIAREANRPNRERLGDRVIHTYEVMQRNLDYLGEIIQNTGSIEAVITRIDSMIQDSTRLNDLGMSSLCSDRYE
ncbi:AAA family ATPase [Herbaspirillum sp. B65]|uniref:AAA family ATPase n=1 Tax=Herbaspirillum sp. B65 TaxID=137708 RepID=UPI0005C95BC1|nr:AAA family ATPase [Herbaspirillum sp. B65]